MKVSCLCLFLALCTVRALADSHLRVKRRINSSTHTSCSLSKGAAESLFSLKACEKGNIRHSEQKETRQRMCVCFLSVLAAFCTSTVVAASQGEWGSQLISGDTIVFEMLLGRCCYMWPFFAGIFN